MLRFILSLAFLCLCGSATAQVRFETKSTDHVREIAIRHNKLVFINLHASWCVYCRDLERKVFARKEVADYMSQHFVPAKYSIEFKTGRQLMNLYGDGSVPLSLVFDTEGNLLARIAGTATPEAFVGFLKQIVAKHQQK